jgi:VanZ family protein
MLFGATDEWHQSFVIGRLADPYDWAADTLGATSAALFLTLLKKH